MGLSLAAIGTAMMLARFVDIAVDPFIGVASDRMRSRFGRRKPFLVVGAAVEGCCLLLSWPRGEAGGFWAGTKAWQHVVAQARAAAEPEPRKCTS
jgi:Na+/melibiose symporter-like transporter